MDEMLPSYTSPQNTKKLLHGSYALYDERVSSEDLVVEHGNRKPHISITDFTSHQQFS